MLVLPAAQEEQVELDGIYSASRFPLSLLRFLRLIVKSYRKSKKEHWDPMVSLKSKYFYNFLKHR